MRADGAVQPGSARIHPRVVRRFRRPRAAAAIGVLVASAWVGGCGGGDAQRAPQATPGPGSPASRAEAGPAGARKTVGLGRALDSELRRRVSSTGVPGAASALVVDGRVLWSGGAGMADIRARRAMTARTPVWFASVGKTVTAAVALALADAGRLRLDDPVRRWVPETRLARSVTLRDLLRHTSGLRDPPERFWVRQYQSTSRRVAPRDWIAVMPPPDPDPGPAPGYENVNFVVAGIAMRRAAGRQWAQFRHRAAPGLVLQPDERVKGRPARSYVFDGARPRPYGGDARLIPSTSIATAAWTAGAWAGSVQRLARWADRLFGGEILRPGSLRDMTRFRPGASMWAGYGLGLARTREEGYETWGHTGDGPGMHAELWHLPRRRLTLATVWNDDLVDDPDIQRALLRTALAHL